MKVRKRCSVRYKKEAEITTERIRNIRRALLARFVCFVSNQTNQRETIQMARQTTANLHWLSLTIFSGDPQKWRELWSNFEAAVHRQVVPEKMSYLLFCLEEASRTVHWYDISPEKYCIFRRILMEKFRNKSTITNLLYSEFQVIKGNDRDWIKIIEAIERILR